MNARNLTAGTPETTPDAWFTPGRFACLLLAVIGVRFPVVLLGKETFFYRDFGLFGYPLAHYQRECFWRGELPLWNPLNLCGLPFLAQWNTLTLYPPALFYLLFPLSWSLAVFNLAHLFLAGMGMYFLARQWTGGQLAAAVAGMAFAINGLSLNMLMWPNDVAGLGWMPWVILTMERAWREGGRRVVWASLAGGMQMLTGAPEVILLTWGLLGVIWLAQFCAGEIPRGPLWGRMFLATGLVGGLAAGQLLPFLELLAHSQRDASYGGSAWAMPGWGWANFIVPLFHCSPSIIGIFSQNEQQWTSSYYLGIGVLALALAAVWRVREPRVAGLAVAAVAGVILSMGENAPLFARVKALLPFLGMMRFPIKIVTLTVFTLPLLAAYGLSSKPGMAPADGRGVRRQFLAVGIILTVLVLAILGYSQGFPLPDESWPVTRESGLSRLVLLGLILMAVWFVRTARSARTSGLAGCGILLLVALDAMTHAPNQNPTVPRVAYGPLGIREAVSARPGESRAALHPKLQSFLSHAATADALKYYTGIRRMLYLDSNLIDGIPVASGFYSLELKSAAPVTSLLGDATGVFPAPLADFAGVSQISSPDTSFTWTARTNFMPLVTAGQKPIFASREEILRAVASLDFDPRHTVYLPESARGIIEVSNSALAVVTNLIFLSQKIEFNAQSDAPTLVVVAQAIYNPWHAYVDGARTKLWEANGAFQALAIPAGRHRVKLTYEDLGFECGALISLASLAVLGVLGFRKRS